MSASTRVQTSTSRINEVIGHLHLLVRRQVYVGFPSGGAARRGQINNASLAYIHEHGSPAANIPARPFLNPGIRQAEARTTQIFRNMAQRVLNGDVNALEQGLNLVGQVAVGEVQRKIVTGPFVPNKPSTIARKGSSRPLIDTGQMRQAVTYVIR